MLHSRLIGFAVAGALGLSAAAAQQLPPQLPATFFGSASVDGKAPPDGTEVRAYVDGIDCTQASNNERRGTIAVDNVANYVVTVMHETQQAGCGREGKRVVLTIGGREVGQGATWRTGPQRLDLNAGIGAPVPLPTPTRPPPPATAAAIATATAGAATATAQAAFTPGPLPTGEVDPAALLRPRAGGAGVPANGGADAPSSGGGGSPVLAIVVTVAVGLVVVGGLGGACLSRRSSRKGPGA